MPTKLKAYFLIAFAFRLPYNVRDEYTSSFKGIVRSRDLPMEDQGLLTRAA
jgi:hypothetical protein